MRMREVPLFVVERRAKNPSRRAPRYKIALVKEAGSVYVTTKPILGPQDVFDIAKALFEDADREAFYVLCLDTKNKIIGVNLVSIGTLTASLIHPREVFKAAILLNSHSIIAVHNHPSGNPKPSRQDDMLTGRLFEAGEILGISLVEHIVTGEDGFYSYQEHERIGPYTDMGAGAVRLWR